MKPVRRTESCDIVETLLTRKSFPNRSVARLRSAAERAISGDTSTPPWLTSQCETLEPSSNLGLELDLEVDLELDVERF